MEWYLKVLKNYVGFSGRARRKEYWMFTLFNVIALFAALMLDKLLGLASEQYGFGPIYSLYALAVFLPGIAVSIRRLHDTDRSGWWLLLSLIPLLGAIVLLVFMLIEGTQGSNRFGADPKSEAGGATVVG